MATKQTQEVHVYVRDLGNGVQEAHVWPPTVFGSAGDTIDFINSTDDDILVTLPDVFGAGNNRKQFGKGSKHSPKVAVGAPKGRTPYGVFCFETGSMAIGNSPPEVIIE